MFWFLLLLIACEKNIKDMPLTQSNVDKLENSKELTGKEYQLLAAYILRTGINNILEKAMQGDTTISLLDSTLTIREAIELQMEWEKNPSIISTEGGILSNDEKLKREKDLGILDKSISVTPLAKRASQNNDFDENIDILIKITNKTERRVMGVKGILKFYDMFDDPICNFRIKYNKSLNPGQTEQETMSFEYNRFLSNHKKFRLTDFNKMNFKWETEKIIFADSSNTTKEETVIDEWHPPPPPPSKEEEDIIFVAYDTEPVPIGGFAAIHKNLTYPDIARRAGVEGTVIIQAIIDKRGIVIDTQVLKSLGNNGCDEAAMFAIKQTRWKPALQRDKPVKVRVSIPVIFKLKESR